MIQAAREQASDLLRRACARAVADGALPAGPRPEPAVAFPDSLAHGDLTTAFCLSQHRLGPSPLAAARTLLRYLDLNGSYFTAAEAAGPGYLNFRLGDKWFADTLADLARPEETVPARPLTGQTVCLRLTGSSSPASALRRDVLREALTGLFVRCGAVVVPDGAENNYVNRITLPVGSCRLTRGGRETEADRSALPPDAAGFLLAARPDRPVTVELEQAAGEDRGNPFYRARYVRRRLDGLTRRAADRTGPAAGEADLSALQRPVQRLAVRTLARYPEALLAAARTRNPGVMAEYLTDLSAALWGFYRSSPPGETASPAQLALAGAGQTVLLRVLSLLLPPF